MRHRQERLFEQQLEVAGESGLNVVIHTRDSWSETSPSSRPMRENPRRVPLFAGTPQDVAEVIRLGS